MIKFTNMTEELKNVTLEELTETLKISKTTAWRKKVGTSKITLCEAEKLYQTGIKQALQASGKCVDLGALIKLIQTN